MAKDMSRSVERQTLAPRRRGAARVLAGLILAAGACAATSGPQAEAGIVAISRESSVRVQLTAGGADPSDRFDDSRSTDQFGTIELSLDGEASALGGPSRIRGVANQFTNVGTTGTAGGAGLLAAGHAAGIVQASFDDADRENTFAGGGALSSMTVRFEVIDMAEEFHLDAFFTNSALSGSSFILLTSDAGEQVFNVNNADAAERTVSRSGLLPVGTYRLFTETQGSTSEPGDNSATVDFRFLAGDAAADPGPNPIPLPPAVFSGAAGLLAAGAATGWRRWSHRRAAR